MELTEAVQAFLVERLLTWQVTLSASQAYFKELADVERQRQRGYRRAAALLAPKNITRPDSSTFAQMSGGVGVTSWNSSRTPSPTNNTTTSGNSNNNTVSPTTSEPPDRGNTWLVPLQAAALKADNETAGLLAYLEGQTLTKLAECKAMFKEHRDAIKARLDGASRDLNESKDRLASTGNDPRSMDPWLARVQRHSRQQHYQRQLTTHQAILTAIYADMAALDRQLTNTLQSIIQEYFLVAGKTAVLFSEQMADMSAVIASVDGPSEWSMAMAKAGVDENWRLTANIIQSPRLMETNLTQRDVVEAIGRFGFLMKQSGGFGKAWTVYFVILTRTTTSLYLHGYRCSSFPVVDNNSNNSNNNMRIPSSSMHLHKRALQELNEEALSVLFTDHPDWLGEPTFSVDFCSPQVAFKADQSTWSVVVTGSGGFFGKSEKRYLFKSWVDEDVKEWSDLIATSLSSLSATVKNHTDTDGSTRGQHEQMSIQEQMSVQEQYMIRHSYGVHQQPEYHHSDDDDSESSKQQQQQQNTNSHSSYSIVPPMENPWNE